MSLVLSQLLEHSPSPSGYVGGMSRMWHGVAMVVKKLAKQGIDFLYNQKKGGLYFNENGENKGFGEGGIIAILKGAPDLSSSNHAFISAID